MLNETIAAHPYLAAFLLLTVWCAIGYLEGRFLSPMMACVTWALAILASALAVIRMDNLRPLGWIMAIAIVSGGTASIIYYYKFHAARHDGISS